MTTIANPPYLIDDVRRPTYGFRERVKGTAPAAATDFTQTLEGRYLTRLVNLSVLLTTDGNAANREVVLEYRSPEGVRFALMGAPVVVTASDTVTYHFMRGYPESAWSIDDSILVPLVDELLLPTESFRLHIVNVQAADTLTVIRFTWERFYTDDVR